MSSFSITDPEVSVQKVPEAICSCCKRRVPPLIGKKANPSFGLCLDCVIELAVIASDDEGDYARSEEFYKNPRIDFLTAYQWVSAAVRRRHKLDPLPLE